MALSAQECILTIQGVISDHETGKPLEYVNVYVTENNQGTTTDSLGQYQLTNLCFKDYHLTFSHIGCDPVNKFVVLDSSMQLDVELDHLAKLLEGVVVTGHHLPNSTQNSQTISEQSIADQADANLSRILDNIAGVSTLKNGSGIAKPIVHGLYGNRLTILNNGIVQSGQQWGNDHSPEIDPLVANSISVVKGVGALEYPGSKLGSVVLVEPARIKKEPHLHGNATYAFSTNGRGSSANMQLYRSSKWFDWKVTTTFKRRGDMKTSSYYLNNTGNTEGNVAIQVHKNFSERLSSDLYFSSFNAELGVLRGSHIGNLTDLESSFEREIPFFTEESFSYSIDAPKQRVNHQLLKSHTKYFLTDVQWVDITIAGQFNNRREFDVRRSGRSEIPALSLQQYTFFAEIKHNLEIREALKLRSGIQVNSINNSNNAETGILPLIPDYLALEMGAYVIATKRIKRSFFEFGVRYDAITQDVPTISNSTPRRIIRYQNFFHNFASSIGWKYELSQKVSAAANLGLATRNPAINELYSNGLHQGVSGIEEGSINLNQEQSLKGTISVQSNGDIYGFDFLAYYQHVEDYIYLSPSSETRLTIRGAFPVFLYQQTEAAIYGFDFTGLINFSEHFKSRVTYSYIRGRDISEAEPLIFMPAPNLMAKFSYKFPVGFKLGTKKIENMEVALDNRYVFRQNAVLAEQDFVAPPDAYSLLGAEISGDLQVNVLRFRLFVKGSNMLNVSYRDYLNRLRYFADDVGVNITMGLRLKF